MQKALHSKTSERAWKKTSRDQSPQKKRDIRRIQLAPSPGQSQRWTPMMFEYDFGLVELALPADEEPQVRDPPFNPTNIRARPPDL
jgi:hypothetical protein